MAEDVQVEAYAQLTGYVVESAPEPEEHVDCDECGAEVLRSTTYTRDGETLCSGCATVFDSRVVCEGCGERVPQNSTDERGGDTLCSGCVRDYDETHVECDRCEETIERGDADERDGDTLCPNCVERYDQEHVACERCENIVDNNDTGDVYVRGGCTETWCESCRDSYTWTCPDCYRTFSDNISGYDIHGQDRTVCRSCRNSYSHCEGCSEWFDSDEVEDGYCSSCAEDSCADENAPSEVVSARIARDTVAIHDYHDVRWRPRLIFYGDPKQIPYGIELEVNAANSTAWATLELLQSPHKEHVFLENDSTLVSGGYEIISHPHTVEEHRKLWSSFFRNLPQGVTSYKTGECGMHVHIDRKRLTKLQIQKILVFVNAPENEHFITKIAQREATRWCQRKPKKLTHDAQDHHDAVYLGNDATVEIRIFRGTVREDRFWKNLEFVDAMVQWTRDISYRDLTYQKFVDYVKSHQTQYKYLFGYLVETGFTQLPLAQIIKETLQQCA